jgi:hypothetical protein
VHYAARRAHHSAHKNLADCVPPHPKTTLTDRINKLLNSSGRGYTLNLCPNTEYATTETILFAFADQTLTTLGNPTGDSRATILVNGSVTGDNPHTTAVDGTCCNNVTLQYVQVGKIPFLLGTKFVTRCYL